MGEKVLKKTAWPYFFSQLGKMSFIYQGNWKGHRKIQSVQQPWALLERKLILLEIKFIQPKAKRMSYSIMTSVIPSAKSTWDILALAKRPCEIVLVKREIV